MDSRYGYSSWFRNQRDRRKAQRLRWFKVVFSKNVGTVRNTNAWMHMNVGTMSPMTVKLSRLIIKSSPVVREACRITINGPGDLFQGPTGTSLMMSKPDRSKPPIRHDAPCTYRGEDNRDLRQECRLGRRVDVIIKLELTVRFLTTGLFNAAGEPTTVPMILSSVKSKCVLCNPGGSRELRQTGTLPHRLSGLPRCCTFTLTECRSPRDAINAEMVRARHLLKLMYAA